MLFVDGVGLAEPSASNAFATVTTPSLDAVLGGSLTVDSLQQTSDRTLVALDATLGVDGLPGLGEPVTRCPNGCLERF